MAFTGLVWFISWVATIDRPSAETNASSGGPNTWPRPRTLGLGNSQRIRPYGSTSSSRRLSSSAISTSPGSARGSDPGARCPGPRAGSSRKALAGRDGALEEGESDRSTGVLARATAPCACTASGHPAGHAVRQGRASTVAPPQHRRSGSPGVQLVIEASGDLLIHSAVFDRAQVLGGGRHYDFAPMFTQI